MTPSPDDLAGKVRESFKFFDNNPTWLLPSVLVPAKEALDELVAQNRALLTRAEELERERDEAQNYAALAAVDKIDRARMPLPARYWLDSVARAQAAEDGLRVAREAVKTAKSIAAAPDYDEEAIRDALWAVVAAIPQAEDGETGDA